ncbi:RluA family pseudouridine synthase [Jejudonia soesokkakensis]|uniref:RluA family pseudouridine synthase n=1 Tax=Jejudonia soesokkakensis TaxID=1323432 RepID=A0ABW2MU79_9FLAO
MASTATYIYGGEQLIFTPEVSENNAIIVEIKIDVLFEDDFLAIVNKPAGLLVSGNKHKTLVNVLPQFLSLSSESDALTTPQPAHRLDFATHGLVVVAKTKSTLVTLQKAFKEKKISKTYYAITIHKLPPDGTITTSVDGKPSETSYKVVQSVASKRFETLHLVQLFPKTGRRHQLRKHLQGIGSPILGDKLYCKPKDILKGKGLYLQATAIKFEHPVTSETVQVSIPLPKKFLKIFPETILLNL